MSGLPRCILFDLDGTLLDSLPGIGFSLRAAFEACGLGAPQADLRALIGPPIRTILSRAGQVEDPSQLDALERAFRASYDAEGWRRTLCFPDAAGVLRRMRGSGRRLFVVSNKPRHISLQILEAEGVLELFEAVVTRDSRSPAYTGKEEMIGSLLESRRLRPQDCLMVGDTMEDAKAAATTGMKFALMTHGYGAVGGSVAVDFRLESFLHFLPLLAKELGCD